MNNELIKPIFISASICDSEGKMSIPGVFDCFMDLAAEHASALGVGFADMKSRGCYWIAVRTRVLLYRRPDMGELVSAETWPGKPGLAKSDRFYRLTSDGELLAEGRTEWAVQDFTTGAIRRTDSYGWPDIQTRPERVCSDPFTRFKQLETGETFSYTVNSMDIDTGKHMNNVSYIRMLLGTYSTAELSAMNIYSAEISYRKACREGDRLLIRRVSEGDSVRFDVIGADGECAVNAVLRYIT